MFTTGNKNGSGPFILVFTPHQRRVWSEILWSEDEFIDNLMLGYYKSDCCAEWLDEDRPTYQDVYDAVGNDLSSLTRLNDARDVRRYIDGLYGKHGLFNGGINSVAEKAAELGWEWLSVDSEVDTTPKKRVKK